MSDHSFPYFNFIITSRRSMARYEHNTSVSAWQSHSIQTKTLVFLDILYFLLHYIRILPFFTDIISSPFIPPNPSHSSLSNTIPFSYKHVSSLHLPLPIHSRVVTTSLTSASTFIFLSVVVGVPMCLCCCNYKLCRLSNCLRGKLRFSFIFVTLTIFPGLCFYLLVTK